MDPIEEGKIFEKLLEGTISREEYKQLIETGKRILIENSDPQYHPIIDALVSLASKSALYIPENPALSERGNELLIKVEMNYATPEENDEFREVVRKDTENGRQTGGFFEYLELSGAMIEADIRRDKGTPLSKRPETRKIYRLLEGSEDAVHHAGYSELMEYLSRLVQDQELRSSEDVHRYMIFEGLLMYLATKSLEQRY